MEFLLDNPIWAVLALCVPLGAYLLRQGDRSLSEFAAAGRALGLVPAEKLAGALPPALTALPLFDRMRLPTFARVLADADRRCFFFDLSLEPPSSPTNSRVWQSVLAFHLPGKRLPRFTAGPGGLMEAALDALSGGNVDFPEDAVFSKAFRLRSEDEAAARACFGAKTRAALSGRSGWQIEGEHEWLLAFRPGRTVEAEALAGFCAEGRIVRDAFL